LDIFQRIPYGNTYKTKKGNKLKETVVKAYKFRILPTKEQEVFFAKHFGCSRFIYNYLLDIRSKAWKEEKRNISGFESKKMISVLKKTDEFTWLKEVNAQSLQDTAINLERGFQRFFKKVNGAGYPTFKKKGRSDSFSVPQHFTVDPSSNSLLIPKCKTPIKVKFHRSLKSVTKFNSLTISKSPSGKYYVSINVYEEIKHKKPVQKVTNKTKTIGLDLGLTDFLVDSHGNKIKNPKYLRKAEKKLKSAQRHLSKKVKGSKNRNKQRIKVARLHEKIKNQRSDFLHKVSSKLVHENQVIYIEDLNVKGMMKNRHLSKSIADVSWGEFARQLKYKAKWNGSIVVQIGRFEPSSKLCSTVGCNFKHTKESLPLSVREWTCPCCGVTHDRDVNAAKNVEQIGRDTTELKPVEKLTSVFSIKKIQVNSMKQESLAS
jgi:putative transposase